jgi:dihydroflavonol-4-reductase
MILVTGATGFVGSAVVRKLIARGHDVRVMVRPASDRKNIEGLKLDIVNGDLLDLATLKAALGGCSGLFHLAADYRLWVPDAASMFKANVLGTKSILMAAKECAVERIVYTSSVAVLGNLPGDLSARENTPVTFEDMIGPYKQSKFLAEVEVRNLIEKYDLGVVIVNPSTPIGPRDIRPTPTGRMIVEAASGRMPAYVDTGLNVVHVDDVAEGHLLAFERGVVGQRYILGGENILLRDILCDIASISYGKAPRFKIPIDAIVPFAYLAEFWARISRGKEPFASVDSLRMAKKKMYFSHEKARRELGYVARPAKQAIIDAVQWFNNHNYIT